MAVSNGSIKVQCPSCTKMLTLSGIRGSVTLNCPYCKSRIKVTSTSQAGREIDHSISMEDDGIDKYEHDVIFIEKFPIIKNIVIKDVLALKKLLLVLLLLGIILSILMVPQANSIERRDYYKTEDLDPDEIIALEESEKRDELDNIWNFYTIIIFFNAIILTFLLNHIYGMEVKRGTMRSLCLYPIDMNGLTVAKILSAALILGIIQIFIFAIPLYPFMAANVFPWMSSVLFMCYIMNLFIIITGAFGSHIITFFTGKLYLSMNRIIVIMIMIYIFLTEMVIGTIGLMVITIRNVSGAKADELYLHYKELGQALGQLSPYHSGGRLVTNSLGHNTGSSDILFVMLIGLVLIIFGYLLGKKIYLDVFIRE